MRLEGSSFQLKTDPLQSIFNLPVKPKKARFLSNTHPDDSRSLATREYSHSFNIETEPIRRLHPLFQYLDDTLQLRFLDIPKKLQRQMDG
jgi:hypothetical protein